MVTGAGSWSGSQARASGFLGGPSRTRGVLVPLRVAGLQGGAQADACLGSQAGTDAPFAYQAWSRGSGWGGAEPGGAADGWAVGAPQWPSVLGRTEGLASAVRRVGAGRRPSAVDGGQPVPRPGAASYLYAERSEDSWRQGSVSPKLRPRRKLLASRLQFPQRRRDWRGGDTWQAGAAVGLVPGEKSGGVGSRRGGRSF